MLTRVFPGAPGVSHPVPWVIVALLVLAAGPGSGLVRAAPGGLVKEIHFSDGKLKERFRYFIDRQNREVRNGLDEEFYPNGSKKGETSWRDGKEDGLVVYYYSDGRKSYEANYNEGRKNGYATVWHPNGQKQWQTVFRDGLTHGLWREWYADGKKKLEANYHDGKLDGLATWWYDNGRIWQERSFQDGNLVRGSVREWDRAGRQTYPAPPDGSGSGEMGGTAMAPVESITQDTAAAGGKFPAEN